MKAFIIKQFHRLKASDNRHVRTILGVLLMVGGILGFLPVLGYWMLPLGLSLLAVDWAWARRLSRRLRLWCARYILGQGKQRH